MFDPFTLALIGGAAGGLLNKKDPLKGALMGAGLGYAGGAVAPKLLGSAPVSSAATDAMADATFGSTGYNTGLGAKQGLLDGVKDGLKTASEYAVPIGQAANAANAVGGLFGTDQQPMQASAPPVVSGGSQALASIAQSDQQGLLALQDADMKRRQQQMAMIQQMMGRNYG